MTSDPDAQSPRASALYELVLEAQPGTESSIRQYAADFFGPVLGDPERTDRLTLATRELLENAMQHGHSDTSMLRIAVESVGPGSRLTITTSNEAMPEDSQAVSRAIEEMRSIDDVAAYYQQVSRRSLGLLDRSGLGIARVFAEAGMVVDSEYDGRRLTVRAEMWLGDRLAQAR